MTLALAVAHPTWLWLGSGAWPHTSGMTFPGATTPFGMVQLSPDTRASFPLSLYPHGEYATGGYGYHDHLLLGFSHTHLEGTGLRDGGVLRVLPIRQTNPRGESKTTLRFRHSDETARPGYYKVGLKSLGVNAELTASPHCGYHRYQSMSSKRPLELYLNVTSGLNPGHKSSQGKIEILNQGNTLRGAVLSNGAFSSRQQGLKTYFYAEVSKPAEKIKIWSGKNWDTNIASPRGGDDLGVALKYSRNTNEVQLKLCVSYVSIENAKLNFDAEAKDVNFDQAQTRAEEQWNQYLNRALIETDDPTTKTLFYTSLYFASLMPSTFTDTNGDYVGFDHEIHSARGFNYVTHLSLWDNFRTVLPLYSLVAPEMERNVVLSLIEMSKNRGVLPRWVFGAVDTSTMFGSPAFFVVSEAYQKGIRDFDVKAALKAMWKGANADEFSREGVCNHYGYCPSDLTGRSVSKTLENAWADFAAAEFAKSAGEADYEHRFRNKELAYRELWDPSTQYFRPKDSNGQFTAFRPNYTSYLSVLYKPASQYAEGSAKQYRWSTSHVQELIQNMGGNAHFVAELEQFMKGASKKRAAFYPGPNYWHGNEPDIHALYLFNEAGRPDLTQYWAKWVMRNRYAVAQNGLDGNDDGGTLSSWYVLSALGLYPQYGTDRYWIGSPAVDSAQLDLGAGRVLKISAPHSNLIYIKTLKVNGKPWCQPTIKQSDLYNAHLEFEMSAQAGDSFSCN